MAPWSFALMADYRDAATPPPSASSHPNGTPQHLGLLPMAPGISCHFQHPNNFLWKWQLLWELSAPSAGCWSADQQEAASLSWLLQGFRKPAPVCKGGSFRMIFPKPFPHFNPLPPSPRNLQFFNKEKQKRWEGQIC